MGKLTRFLAAVSTLILINLSKHTIFGHVPPLNNELEFGFDIFDEKVDLDVDNFLKISKDNLAIRPVIPSYYRIKLRPLFDPIESPEERFTAPGSALIWVECVESTKTITLNSKLITIEQNSVKVISREDYKEIEIISQTGDEEEGKYTLQLAESLQPTHSYEIRIDYTAPVSRDRMSGLYLSNYTDPTTNEMKYLATTQFEPYGARQMFPCFDDPDLKAIFDISVGRREKYNSLSNMNVFQTEPIESLEGWYWDHYNSTVKMSTYLIALVVSEFTSETADASLFSGKPVKVWGPKHKIDKKGGVFSATTVANILHYYEDYFQAKYPLPKMDSAEIPHFAAGAMENYGLNTYRENYLFYIPGESTESQRYTIATVIAHELGHQWFGDLVTTKTWPHIWLNEGFASYVEVLGIEKTYPEFDNWNMFVPSTLQVAFQFDQSAASHPIVEESISYGRFDRITYKKGSSLIRMMHGFLGEEPLRAGLQHYLAKFSFGNAHQSDLFDALQETAQRLGTFSNLTSVGEIMNSWTLQKGYPLVRVLLGDSASKIYLTQEPFVDKTINTTESKPTREKESGIGLWWIPVNVATKNSPAIKSGQTDFWIPKNVGTLLKSDVDASDWLVINPDAVGYYRVLYDETLTKRIHGLLETNHEVLSANKRSQLIDDYFNFAWSDYVAIEKTLDLTTYLVKETELNVWTTVLRHFVKTYNLFSNTEGYQSLRNYLMPKVSSALKRVGLTTKPEEKGAPILLRNRLIDWACALEDSECTRFAAEIYQKWISSPEQNPISVDVRSTVYCSAVASSDLSVWETTLGKYKAEKAGAHKSALLRALSCSKNIDTLKWFLELLLDPESGVEKKDVAPALQYVISNSAGRNAALEYVKANLLRIVDYLGNVKPLGTILEPMSRYLQDAEEFQTFVDSYTELLEPLNTQIKTATEVLQQNKAWTAKFYEPMKSWFEKHASVLDEV